MTILTYSELSKLICSDKSKLTDSNIYIHPYDKENCLTPMSYDLRVGGTYRRYDSESGEIDKLKPDGKITLKPGETVLVVTREIVGLPKNGSLSALIVSKLKVVAMGFSGISTKVDPGWNSELRVAVHNISKQELELKFDDPFCTIIFLKNNTNEKHQYTGQSMNPLGLPYRKEKSFPWHYASLLPVVILPGITYLWKGETVLLTASMAASIFLAQLLEKWIPKR